MKFPTTESKGQVGPLGGKVPSYHPLAQCMSLCGELHYRTNPTP